jgi:histidinol phosphatase-like PHP family hydrolase
MKDYHFHYDPRHHNQYDYYINNVITDGIMVIHKNQMRLNDFVRGLEEFRGKINIGIELSANSNYNKMERDIKELEEKNYKIILSLHTYKDSLHYLEVLKSIYPLLTRVHHLGHPFHKETIPLSDFVIEDFISFCLAQNVLVELNERYLRKHLVNFYKEVKERLNFLYSTDAHIPNKIGVYNKMKQYFLL